MTDVLVVSDSPAVRADIRAALGGKGVTIREITRGAEVLAAAREQTPDLAVLDMQVGKMGAMATCMDLRLEEGAGRLPHIPVMVLLDRRPDVFLARSTGAEGWVVKPLDALRIARAAKALLSGGRYEDTTNEPVTVALG
jgi:CheY-like chemotaxis protein